MLAAEIVIPKPSDAFPTPYIYISNRNHPSGNDTIAIFSFAVRGELTPENFELKRVAEIKTGLVHIRGMALSPDGKYLAAAGQQSNSVKVFERVDGGLGLKESGEAPAKAPTGLLWL
jgi:6-phosphogluconolactonase (cycloisomerase 2 family)